MSAAPFKKVDSVHISTYDEQPSYERRDAPAEASAQRFAPEVDASEQRWTYAVGPYWVVLDLAVVSGRLEAVRLEIRGFANGEDPAAAPILVRALRSLPIGALIDDARSEFARNAERARTSFAARDRLPEDLREELVRDAESELAARQRPAPRVGRPPLPIEYVERAAKEYNRALGRFSKKPTLETALAIKEPYGTAVKWIAKARRRGLIPPAPPRKSLTPKRPDEKGRRK